MRQLHLVTTAVLLLGGLSALGRAQDREALFGRQPALPLSAAGPASARVPVEAARVYAVPEERFEIRLGAPSGGQTFVARRASFPSAVRERWPEVHGTYYLPRRPGRGPLPAAVVVHHLGGSFEAEAYLAQFLAQHGVATFAIELPNYGARQAPGTRQGFLRRGDPTSVAEGFRQAVLDVVRAGDFLRAQPEVDPERVGIVGVSLGAFVSALARGVDPRLRRTVLVLGGGDPAQILIHAREVRELMEGVEVDLEQMRAFLRPYDPVTFAGAIPAAEVLMINASRDEVVPEASTRALWSALGQPRIEWLDCGHYGAVLHAPWLMNQTLDHLRGRTAF